MGIAAQERRESAGTPCAQVGLENYAHAYPDESFPVGCVSVLAARALAINLISLLMDEVKLALDPLIRTENAALSLVQITGETSAPGRFLTPRS